MKRILIISLSALCLVQTALSQDSTLHRSVMVERDFQPVVQSAGKVQVRPQVVETTLPPVTLHYSDYTANLSPDFNVNPLLSQPTRFTTPTTYNGYVRGGLGHTNTLFDFAYHLDDRKNSVLDVYANHLAQWGRRTHSFSQVGFDFKHVFSGCDLYFGVRGANTYYTRYGRYYDGNKGLTIGRYREFAPEDKQTIWNMDAFAGVRSNNKSDDIQYKVQVGYTLFALPDSVSEHQIRTTANIDWHSSEHHVGGNIYMQNSFMQTDIVAREAYNPRHSLRLEPYYAYQGNRFRIHAGVNFDLNIGRGTFLSTVDNVSFAPSPQVSFEAQIAKKWLTLYGSAEGRFAMGTVEACMNAIPYREIRPLITSHHVAPYTPIDALLGFRIKAHRDLLVDIYGGYAYQLNQLSTISTLQTTSTGLLPGTISYIYSDYGRGQIGASFSYHYQDIIRIRLYGTYYFWEAFRHENTEEVIVNDWQQTVVNKPGYEGVAIRPDGVYDRANWEIGLRIDARIDKHWSLYSDNYFAGSRTALVSLPDAAGSFERTLKPTIRLNLGCQYETVIGRQARNAKNQQPNFKVFFELNNYIHRRNDLWYGYQTEGIQGLIGVTYRF